MCAVRRFQLPSSKQLMRTLPFDQIPRSCTYKQELALTNEMELFVFTWANQSFVCYVMFFISCSPRDLPARHATLKNSCKTKTTIDFLACYFDL